MNRHHLPPLLRLLAAALLAAVLLGGCSGGADDAGSSSGGDIDAMNLGDDVPVTAGAEKPARDYGAGSKDQAGAAGRVVVETRRLIRTGAVELHGEDLGALRDDVDRLLGRYGGYVADERSSDDQDGRLERSDLQLRVPAQRFDTVMAELEDLAPRADTSRAQEDVTTEVIDIDARIRTQEASLVRLRSFLKRAADLDTILRYESEITRREADLESMRAQQAYLDDQTTMATIKLSMRLVTTVEEETDDALDDAGFLAGLDGGWHALRAALVVTATVLGALLPFAVVAAVLAAPVVLWLRASRRRRTPPAAPAEPA